MHDWLRRLALTAFGHGDAVVRVARGGRGRWRWHADLTTRGGARHRANGPVHGFESAALARAAAEACLPGWRIDFYIEEEPCEPCA